MNKKLTLGSLFDGSGSFPVAGILSGIQPIWKSEIEPFPIAVTNKRLPQVKHYGDISAINGAEIEPVDIITFRSPCRKAYGHSGGAFGAVLSGNPSYQRNEVCYKWPISKIYRVGKCHRCIFLKFRRRFQDSP